MVKVATEIVVGFVAREGRILVRRRERDPELAGAWELPGGKVAPGESHAAALAREVAEETGMAVEVGELVCALCHGYGDRRVALYAYVCAPAGGVAARQGLRAAAGARWVALGEYRALSIPPANPPLVEALAWTWRRKGSPVS